MGYVDEPLDNVAAEWSKNFMTESGCIDRVAKETNSTTPVGKYVTINITFPLLCSQLIA